ncbi:MAG: hypothetical protein ACK47B_18200 [Armatimonadota bacterium]
MYPELDSPSVRADQLLRDVLGTAAYQRLKEVGYLDLPSGKRPGRIYRLDSLGNLSYRDPGDTAFHTSLCVQPTEAVPRDDQVVMRYLLVTADEERLLRTANPISFTFTSLARALQHDFSQRFAPATAWALTMLAIVVSIASLIGEAAVLYHSMSLHPGATLALFLVLFLPALIGIVLAAAAVAEVWRAISVWKARLRLETASG